MNGPKLWSKLLAEAPKDSVLMGGAVIDYMVDMEAKDYDIFHVYKPQPMIVPPNWELTDVNFNDEAWVAQHQKEYLQGIDGNGNYPIGSVNEYIVDGEHKVQLIGVMYVDANQHFKNFDHSLTLGRYTKRGMFIHQKVFESFQTETITYVSKNPGPVQKVRSLERAKRKALKYGGEWTYKGFE